MTQQTQAVATTPDSAEPPALFLSDVEWASDGTEEIKPTFPMLAITQPVSKFTTDATKHAGEFWATDKQSYEATLEVVPLFMTPQQALFEEGKAVPSCVSIDGKRPLPGQPLWSQDTYQLRSGPPLAVPLFSQPKLCAECPFSAFGPSGERPGCNETILLLLEREDKTFAKLRFGGTSLKPFRKFVSNRLVHKNKRIPLFTHSLHLYTEPRQTDRGSWYELAIDGDPLPLEDQKHYNALVNELRPYLEQAVQEAEHDAPEAPAAGNGTQWGDGPESYAGRNSPQGDPGPQAPPAGWVDPDDD